MSEVISTVQTAQPINQSKKEINTNTPFASDAESEKGNDYDFLSGLGIVGSGTKMLETL